MATVHTRHILSLALCVGVHFTAVTFLLPLLPNLGVTSPWFETAFSLAHILALPLMGRLADRFGTRPVLVVSLLGASCAFAMLAFNQSPSWLLAARLLAGASSAVLPVCFGWIRRHVPEGPGRTRGIAALMLGVSLGAAAGPITSGSLAHGPLWLPAGMGAVLSLLVIFFLKLPKGDRAGEREPFSIRWQTVLGSRELMTMALTFLAASTAFYLFRPLLPFQLTTSLERGIFIGCLSLTSGVAQLPFLFRQPRKPLRGFLLSLGGIVLSFALALATRDLLLLIPILGLAVGYGVADALGGLVLIDLTKKHHAAETAGIVFGVGALGKILGPSLAGLFTLHALLTEGTLAAIVFAGMSFLLVLSLAKQRKSS